MKYYSLCDVGGFYNFEIPIFLEFLILLSDKYKEDNTRTLKKLNFRETLFWSAALGSSYKDGKLDQSILKCFGKEYSKELIDKFILWHKRRLTKLKELNVSNFNKTKFNQL